MIRNFIIVAIALLFVSCATHEKILKPNEQAFVGEDTYIMFALRAEQLKDYKSAASLFEKLYNKSSKKEYLYHFLANELRAKENQKVINKVNELTQGSLSDPKLVRYKIIALIENSKLDKAKILAIHLATQTKNADDYLLASDVYIKKKQFDMALKYLDSAYVEEYNEKILDKMAVLLYSNLNRKKDAIAYLETHTRVHGCSPLICNRLIGIYSNENNIDGLLSAYKRLYRVEKKEVIAKKIMQIYAYKKDYVQMINFLEDTKADDEVLLQLYITGKNYEKASKLSAKLYEKSGDINYLGQSAIYKYESVGKKISKKTLKNVIEELEKVATQTQEALYYNYLGYILIDHEVNVKKGMKYIRKVLKDNPNSAYYLDSLAWGYYKLDECKEAKKIMNKVVTLEGGDNKEVLEHINAINKCLKNIKVKNKK
ncbi:hypothetical protein [Sulfurimonas sp.]